MQIICVLWTHHVGCKLILWGANSSTMRTTALALSYSPAEYTCQCGTNQLTHTKLILYGMMHIAPSQNVYSLLISIMCIYYPVSPPAMRRSVDAQINMDHTCHWRDPIHSKNLTVVQPPTVCTRRTNADN